MIRCGNFLKMLDKVLVMLIFVFPGLVFAENPRYEVKDRQSIILISDLVFSGWPSSAEPILKCENELARWWVHKVYKGDKNLEGKVLSVGSVKNDTKIILEQSTSFLYLKKKSNGCFELTNSQSQDHGFNEPVIDAFFASNEDCSLSTRGLEFLIDFMPKDCEYDKDCQVYIEHPMRCMRPYVWNKKANLKMDENYQYLKIKAAKACASSYSYVADCKISDIPFFCKDKKCFQGYSKEKAKSAVQFTKALIHSACAPHDGPAMMVTLVSKEKTGPLASLSWWGEGYLTLANKNATFSSENAKGFNASFCPRPQACKTIKKIRLKIERDTHNAGVIKYYFETIDQEIFEGTLPIMNEPPSNNMLCG